MNIVFDIGNVLLAWDPRALYRKIFASEAEVDWFLTHVCPPEWNVEQDRGRSFEDAVAEAIARHPDHAEAIAAYNARWPETLTHVIDGTVEILEELQANGTPLYAITNWNGDKFRETKARFAFLHHFRDIVVSGDERMIKPDPEIFELLIARNGLDPSSCLFIDDSHKNVIGAEAVGMKAHHFTSPEKLRVHLEDIGVLPARR